MLRNGAETFILAVQAFYAGPLMEAIFAENKHNALRRSITSLLAGDVFTDAVWLRDTKLRLKEMARGAPHRDLTRFDAERANVLLYVSTHRSGQRRHRRRDRCERRRFQASF